MRGWRKWSIAAGALMLAFVLAWVERLTGEFVTVATVAVAAFSASNAFIKRGGSPNGSQPSDG